MPPRSTAVFDLEAHVAWEITIRLGWSNAPLVLGDHSVLFDAGSPGDERASLARVGPGRKHRPGRRLRR